METRELRGRTVANAAALALLAALVSEAAFHHWNVSTAVVQITAVVLLTVGTFILVLVRSLLRVENKLRATRANFDVVQYRIGIHKGIAAVLDGVPTSGEDDEEQLQWLTYRAVEVLRTDRFLSQEKVDQVEEIAGDESLSAAERLAKLEEHLRARLIEGRYLLP